MSTHDKGLQNLHLKQLEFQAHLEEYKALRAEQRTKSANQRNIIYLLVVLLATILGAIISIPHTEFSEIKKALPYLLLATPIFTSALAFLYLENDLMIMRIGQYISQDLRKRVTQITSAENLWQWDTYHARESEERKFTPAGGIPLFSRLVLISSILVPLIAFFISAPIPYDALQIVLTVLDSTLLLFVLISNVYIKNYFFEQIREQSNKIPMSFKLTNLYTKAIKAFIKKQEGLRAQKISQLCKGFIKPGGNVLDLGSGPGYIAKQIEKDYGVKITCADIIDYNQTSLPLVLYEGKNLPFEENTFNTVLLVFVLHHSNNALDLLQETKRVLHQQGSIIIFEDIYINWLECLIALMMDFFLNLYYRVRTPFNFRQESEWISIFEELGLEVKHKKLIRLYKWDPVKHIFFVLGKKPKHNIGIE